MLPQPEEGTLVWQVPTRCCSLLFTELVTWAPLLVMEEPILLSTCNRKEGDNARRCSDQGSGSG